MKAWFCATLGRLVTSWCAKREQRGRGFLWRGSLLPLGREAAPKKRRALRTRAGASSLATKSVLAGNQWAVSSITQHWPWVEMSSSSVLPLSCKQS
ncbi:hypothetical protein SAMN03159293_04444 [Pseudomonas sp. NFACC39-1]|nr:hypothetical protein SAMN03159293_04444 [Pseudomonas sp. NFACC39-1]